MIKPVEKDQQEDGENLPKGGKLQVDEKDEKPSLGKARDEENFSNALGSHLIDPGLVNDSKAAKLRNNLYLLERLGPGIFQ